MREYKKVDEKVIKVKKEYEGEREDIIKGLINEKIEEEVEKKEKIEYVK